MVDGAQPVDGDPLAHIGQRIVARLVDWMLLFAGWLLLGGATSSELDDGTLTNPRWAVLVWIAAVVVYETAFVAASGQTPGKMLVGIEIVMLRTGKTPRWGPALLRVIPVGVAMSLLSTFFPVVMVLVYFTAAFLPNSRGVLDLIAGTVVIQARRRRVLPGLPA